MSVLGLVARQTKILILDGHQGSRTLLRRELQSAHYDVVTAENREECLILARTIIPDLVLVSARLSEMERLEMLEQLKAHEKTSEIPIIVLADKSEFEKIGWSFELGIEDFIEVPFIRENLHGRVRKALITRQGKKKSSDGQPFANMTGSILNGIRVSMMGIAALAEMIESQVARGKSQMATSYSHTLSHHALEILDVIHDLKDLVESKKDIEIFDLSEVLRFLVDSIKFREGERNISLLKGVPEGIPLPIRGRRDHLRTGLKLLLCYADRASDSSHPFVIELIPKSDTVRAEIKIGPLSDSDSVPVNINDHAELRSNSSNGIRLQASLSLNLAKLIIEEHGGRIGQLQLNGRWLLFWVELPLCPIFNETPPM